MKKRFKHNHLQSVYEFFLKNTPLNRDGTENHGSSWHDWFWKGVHGVPFHRVPKNSQAHACWAAGQDYEKIIQTGMRKLKDPEKEVKKNG